MPVLLFAEPAEAPKFREEIEKWEQATLERPNDTERRHGPCPWECGLGCPDDVFPCARWGARNDECWDRLLELAKGG